MNKLWSSVLTGIAAALVFAACGKKEESAKTATADAPLPEPPILFTNTPGIPGGRLVVAAIGDPKTFNPITSNETSSSDIIRFLFGALTSYDYTTQEVIPALAESWSVEPDNRTWTFKLRKGLKWSDGHPLTADDVVFTWEVIYNPEIDNVTADLYRIDGKNFEVTKIDDLTVRVVTPAPYAPFAEFFGGASIIPKHILSKAVEEKRFASAYGINTPPNEIVGCGPFILKQFKPGELTLLERNPHYIVADSKNQRLPYFQHVIYTVVPDQNAMSLRFLNGESDAHEYVRPDEYDRYKEFADKGRFQLFDLGPAVEKAFFWFNLNTNVNEKTGKPIVSSAKMKWFRNTKFRQAVSHAIDRDSIVKSIYNGRATPSYGFVPVANKRWFNPNTPKFPYDVQKARALLAEIDIKDRNGDGVMEDADGNVIEFVMNTNTGNNVRDKTAVLINDDLKKLGFKIIYQPLEFNTLVDKINNSYDYECILLGLGGGGLDPASSMNVLLSNGFTHQWFPRQKVPSTEWEARIDELMNLQIKTLDFEQRKKYYDEVQHILCEQQPMIFTVTPDVYAAAKNELHNTRPTALSTWRVTWNAEELFFKK